eukprot:1980276-Alexandrium_andersonii.AAC.1
MPLATDARGELGELDNLPTPRGQASPQTREARTRFVASVPVESGSVDRFGSIDIPLRRPA